MGVIGETMNGATANEERIEDDEINLLDYWKVLVKRKLLIGVIVGVAFVASIVYSLILPKIYVSTATIFPPQQESSPAAGIISQLPGGLGGLVGGLMGSSADLWIAILNSETIREPIINRFELMKVFETKSVESARNALKGMVKVSKSKDGIISITVEDKDPRMAADMANAYVEELDRINKSMVTTAGRRMRVFVEVRLKDAKVELVKSEEAIKGFQERNKAVKLDDQSRAVFEAIGSLKGQLMAKEVELQTLLSYATPNNPQAELLKTQVDELKEKLRELEEGKSRPGNPSTKDIFIPTSKIPDLSLQYVRLLRDAKVQQTLYELLTQQYEMARIQEAKDTPTVQVLDAAKMAEVRSKPKRRQIVMLSTITAAFFAVFAAFFMEYIEKVRIQQP
ncbi:MAG: lipopolysaccharide biosynthesis protein [Nitrospirae bacterium]|nr:lipopolysaccharide biosynthesis protein [Nitrospirota bacterium]